MSGHRLSSRPPAAILLGHSEGFAAAAVGGIQQVSYDMPLDYLDVHELSMARIILPPVAGFTGCLFRDGGVGGTVCLHGLRPGSARLYIHTGLTGCQKVQDANDTSDVLCVEDGHHTVSM